MRRSQINTADNNPNLVGLPLDCNIGIFFTQIQYLASNPEKKGNSQKDKQAGENRKKYMKSLKTAFGLRNENLSEEFEVKKGRDENLWYLVDKKGKTYHVRKGNLNVYLQRLEEDDGRLLAQEKNNRIEIHLIIND